MQLALKSLGFSVNYWRDESMAQTERLLIELKPQLVAFASGNGHDLLLVGEVDVAGTRAMPI